MVGLMAQTQRWPGDLACLCVPAEQLTYTARQKLLQQNYLNIITVITPAL